VRLHLLSSSASRTMLREIDREPFFYTNVASGQFWWSDVNQSGDDNLVDDPNCYNMSFTATSDPNWVDFIFFGGSPRFESNCL
jgi:hypothetical protein